MEQRISALEREKKYADIVALTKDLSPTGCDSLDIAHAAATAHWEQQRYAFATQWLLRAFALDPSDEALGMALDMLLATGQVERADELLQQAEEFEGGYYHTAGKCQLAFRKHLPLDEQIAVLEDFVGSYEEESYMVYLVTSYISNGQERESARLCRKIPRLFVNGKAVEYAVAVQESLKQGQGENFVQENPWYEDCIFPHLSFDPNAPIYKDVLVQTKPAKPEPQKDRIAPIIEKCLENVIGMAELRTSLNNIFNIMQVSRKRMGSVQIMKDNIRIYGPDGCGKTTAALASADVLAKVGTIGDGEVQIGDYYSLVGSTPEQTHENVEKLFQSAVNGCVIIDNIHEFNDSGAYGLGLDAIDQIIKAYFAANEKIPLIITGREAETEALLASKKKLADLFNLPVVHLGEYTVEELLKLAVHLADAKNLVLADDACTRIEEQLTQLVKQHDFKYSRDLETMINMACVRQSNRLAKKRRVPDMEYYILRAEDFEGESSTETVEDLLQQLNQMTGLAEVKTQVNKIVNQMRVQQMRQKSGIAGPQGHGSLHMMFLGNAGTGKTTVARIIGKIYKRLDILPTGQLIECTRRDLVSQYVGGTSLKVSEKIKEAMGGILFIDEAYSLCKNDQDTYGREAIDTLLADIENHRDSLMVILAGYGPDMQKFMDQNQGLRSRIPTEIVFEDYSTEEMVQIFKSNVKKQGMILDEGLDEKIWELIETRRKQKDFGNARGVRNLFEEIRLNQDNRLGTMNPAELNIDDFLTIKAVDIPVPEKKTKGHQQYLDELLSMTGLAAVKEKVNNVVSTVEVNQAMMEIGMPVQDFGTLHMVFKGNAGTGKTTVARLIGSIYRELGVLSSGHLVECDRSALVGQYVGSTAAKVKEKVQEAMGGILFIDEAYALAKGGENDFGKEAIDTLVADIENYRKDLMVIIAGYSEEMDVFLDQNQGLRSRFPNEIIFEDYTNEELFTIFKRNVASRNLVIADDLDTLAQLVIRHHSAKENFGNARGVRNLVDKLCEHRNVRIAAMIRSGNRYTKEDLQMIVEEDLQKLL